MPEWAEMALCSYLEEGPAREPWHRGPAAQRFWWRVRRVMRWALAIVVFYLGLTAGVFG